MTRLLTASLTGSGGVTITAPDNNATLTFPVHVTANVSSSTPGFGSVKTMQVFRDNTLVYQGAGTTVDTNVALSASATHNLTVLALKQNGALEGSATVYVTVVTATPSPLPPPPSAVLGVLGLNLPANAAGTNPATIPTGFAAPCPVFSLSTNSVSQSGTLTLSALRRPAPTISSPPHISPTVRTGTPTLSQVTMRYRITLAPKHLSLSPPGN